MFHEFGWRRPPAAAGLAGQPWTLVVDGLVEARIEIGTDELVRRFPAEERVSRHRCVEGWSMTVPWTGVPLRALLALARPLGSARYVAFESFDDPGLAPGQRDRSRPWPYREALAIREAAHDLCFLATGAYGRTLPEASGFPLRLVVPWKYAFKGPKSLVRITLTEERPATFRASLAPGEHGFWGNVMPLKGHPLRDQTLETPLGEAEPRPTLPFNGYGEAVAGLYRGLEGEALWV